MQISIPVAWLFLPVTLPVKLVRLILAGVTAVVISPATFIGCLEYEGPDTVIGYSRKYEVLSRETHKDTSLMTWIARKVKVRPGLIGSIAGYRATELELWTSPSGIAQPFIAPSGEPADKRLVSGVTKAVDSLQKKKELQKTIAYNQGLVAKAQAE